MKRYFHEIIFIFLFLLICHDQIFAENIDSIPDTSFKNKLSDNELRDKLEDGYFTFVAGPAISPDAGVGGGGIINFFYNGKRDDRLFPYTPYRHRISMLAMYQSRGYASFDLQWDAPYFLDTAFRFFADISYNINPVESFFGVGEKTLETLKDPSDHIFEKMSDYESSLRQITNGNTFAYYNYYDQRWFDGRLMVQHDFIGGVFRVLAGYLVRNYQITDYSFQKIDLAGVNGKTTAAIMGNTALYNDYLAGNISGFSGGWNNSLMLSLVYDNRDFEPNARRGMFHDITMLHQAKWLGSDFNYTELTAGSRYYFTPFDKLDLVIAARFAASYKFGQSIPFFGLTTMQFSNQWFNILGDMRGYRKSRFLAPLTTLANLEIRYTPLDWKWGKQIFALTIAPFIDIASVFDRLENFSIINSQTISGQPVINWDRWKVGYGAGVRVAWNQATVIRFDFGFSKEDFGFYLLVNNVY